MPSMSWGYRQPVQLALTEILGPYAYPASAFSQWSSPLPFGHQDLSGPGALTGDTLLASLPTSLSHSFVFAHFIPHFLAAFLPRC